ncbi:MULTISPECIES: hypothetical protein [Delftia]|uniref:Uncharacterized protein n=1 Tax=Delftia deserti TaxID=1651218 RepID=A0ABW5EMU3_9BURK
MYKSSHHENSREFQEIYSQLKKALETLKRSGSEISVMRARAIAACAAEIVDSIKIEAGQSSINEDKQ